LRGAYHYLVAGQDAAKQADLFIATVGEDRGELPPVVDVEDRYNENESNTRIITTCKAVMDRIENAFGRKPMIYSRRTYFQAHVTIHGRPPEWARDYPLWVAQYPWVFSTATMPNANMPVQPEGWQNWKFWQYSESAIIDGVTDESGLPTRCDLDWFRGTEAELYAFANVQQKKPIVHIVQQGETLKAIADKYQLAMDELLNSNPDLIKTGVKLTIPIPTIPDLIDSEPDHDDEGTPATTTRTHVVKDGEYLSVIAAKYSVTVEKIMALNPQITNKNLIIVGQVIVIP
jgi:LysM repeat protein